MRAILTYHSIDPSGSPISISPAEFARHVQWLATGRVRVVTVDELIRLPETADAVAITFDDGFQSVADVAAPLLTDHGMPATVFVVTDAVGRTNAWGGSGDPGVPVLPLMDWDSLARLGARGFAIGAHTRTHRRLTRVDASELHDELAGAARVIEQRIGHAPAGIAYPYGVVTPESVRLVRARYAWGCTTELRAFSRAEDPTRLPRLDTYYFRTPGRLESWGSMRFSCYLHIRSRARRLRQRLAGQAA